MATTTAKSGTTPAETPPRRSLWKRLLGRLVLLILVAAVGGGGYLYYRSNHLIKSEPYQAVLKFVNESEIVKDKVGGPLHEAGFLEKLQNSSSITEEGERGEALIKFTLQSPRGPLEVQSNGRKLANEWSITSLMVRFPGEQDNTSLLAEVHRKTAGETPKFDPTKAPEKIDTKIDLPTPGTDIKIDLGDLPTVPEK